MKKKIDYSKYDLLSVNATRCISLGVMLLLVASNANAAILKEYVFTGVVSAATGVTGTSISDTITGHFTYDYDTPLVAVASSDTIGNYYGAITEFSMKFGDYELEIANPGVVSAFNFITIANNNPTGLLGLRDRFVIGALMDTDTGPLEAFNANIDMLAGLGTFFDTSLPDFLDARAFDPRSISVRLRPSSGADVFVYGNLTTLKAIPEPSTFALLSLGGLLIARRRHFSL